MGQPRKDPLEPDRPAKQPGVCSSGGGEGVVEQGLAGERHLDAAQQRRPRLGRWCPPASQRRKPSTVRAARWGHSAQQTLTPALSSGRICSEGPSFREQCSGARGRRGVGTPRGLPGGSSGSKGQRWPGCLLSGAQSKTGCPQDKSPLRPGGRCGLWPAGSTGLCILRGCRKKIVGQRPQSGKAWRSAVCTGRAGT